MVQTLNKSISFFQAKADQKKESDKVKETSVELDVSILEWFEINKVSLKSGLVFVFAPVYHLLSIAFELHSFILLDI